MGEVDFASTVDWELVKTNERLEEVALELSSWPLLAIDTENTGIDPILKKPLLLQIGNHKKCFIFEGYNKDLDFSILKPILEQEAVPCLFFNAKYDWKWILYHYDINVNNIYCCQQVERLLTVGLPGAPKRPSLAGTILKYMGITLDKSVRGNFIERDVKFDPITDIEFAYGAADTALLIDLYHIQEALVDNLELRGVVQLENEVLPVLALAELVGVYIDKQRWRELITDVVKSHKEVSGDIYKCFADVLPQRTLFGAPNFNIASNQQLLDNLAKLGFELPDTQDSTLNIYKDKHIVFKHLIRWRGLQKLYKSYGQKILNKVNPITGRLHCNYNQSEADTGRSSSSGPNLQQVPGYDSDAQDSFDFRSCFKAKEGYVLITADFSQQELRILADITGDPTFLKAYTERDENGRLLDVHRYTASVIFEVPYLEVTPTQRKKAKTLNFFLVYGGSAHALAMRLGISEEEAQEIIDAYFKRYSKIKYYLDNAGKEAFHNGLARTVSGRIRFLPFPKDIEPGSREYSKERAAIERRGKNTGIQGGGADVTKKALVLVDRGLRAAGLDATILMVVHDELVVEVREDQAPQAAKIIEEQMIAAFAFYFKKIPMTVDAVISDTWEK